MALSKNKIPIKLTGIDTKSDDKQSPVGSFKSVNNAIYSKIGKLEKRTAYSSKLEALYEKFDKLGKNNGYNYTNYSDNIVIEKFGKHDEQRLLLANTNGHKKDLHNKYGYLQNADVLAVDYNVKNITSQTGVNEQFQTADSMKIFNSGASSQAEAYLNVDALGRSYNLQLRIDNIIFYDRKVTIENLTGLSTFSDISVPKIKIFQRNGGPVGFNAVVLVSIKNNIDNKYYIFTQSVSILFNFGANVYVLAGDVFGNIGSCSTNINRRFFDIDKINENNFMVIRNYLDGFGFCNLTTEHYNIDSISGVINPVFTGMSGNIVLTGSIFTSGNCVSITKVPAAAFGENNTYTYFVYALNKMSVTEATGTIDQAIVYGVKRIFTNLTSVSALNYRLGITYTPTETYNRIINISIGEYDAPDSTGKITTFIKNVGIYATVGKHSMAEVPQVIGGNYLNNKILKLQYNTVLLTATEKVMFTHQTLVSKPISMNYADYLFTVHNSIYQPSVFLNTVDKRVNIETKTQLAQFFYENTSYFKPYLKKEGYYYSEEVNFLVNYGWVSNIGVLNSESAITDKQKFTDTNDSVKLIGSFPYRDNFVNDNNILIKTKEKPSTNFQIFDYNNLEYYTENKSSKSVIFELNAKSKFASVQLNKSTFFTGGSLSYFDGNKLNASGFHQTPELYHGLFAYGDRFRNQVTAINTATDRFSVVASEYESDQKVRIICFSGDLPVGVAIDSAFSLLLDSSGTTKVSIEYEVSVVSSIGSTTKAVGLKGLDITSTTGVDFSQIWIYKSPYSILPYSLNPYQFYAVYEYLDSNGNLGRSAPSRPIYVKSLNPIASILKLTVSNYLFDDKISTSSVNNVKIKIYRTLVNGPAVYYKCGEKMCDLTSNIIDVEITTLEDDLVSQELLYTVGGVLENFSSFGVSAITSKNNRVFAVNAEDKREIRYSKRIISGEVIEFNDLQTIRIDNTDGDILNIMNMDDKIFIFKKNEIYYFSGDGVDELGKNYGFTNPEKISGEIGIDPLSYQAIALTQMGIFFKSNRGLYLISRGGGLEYVGSFIEEYVKTSESGANTNLLFHNICSDYKTNSVRVTTSVGIFTYNIEQTVWTRSVYFEDLSLSPGYSNSNPIFSYVDDVDDIILSNIIYLRQNTLSYNITANLILEKLNNAMNQFKYIDIISVTPYAPANVSLQAGTVVNLPVRMSWETNFISLTTIQNYGRLWNVWVIGDRDAFGQLGSKEYKLNLKFDYENDATDSGGVSLVENHTYTDTIAAWFGGAANPRKLLQFSVHLKKQKCQSFKLIFKESDLNAIGNPMLSSSLTISSIMVEVGIKPKTSLGQSKRAK